MKSFEQFLETFIDIRRHEYGRVLLMSCYLLLIIAAYSITKAVRDSLFVTKIGPAQLPYVYLLIAATMGVVSVFHSRAVRRIGVYRLIQTTLLAAISNLVLFWVVFKNHSSFWFYVLYVWVSVFGVITASQFWLLATHVFDAREARRVFAWIGVGGILGGVVGGGITNRFAHLFGTESLLIVCAGVLVPTLILLRRISAGNHNVLHSESAVEERPDEKLFNVVRQSRHLSVLALLLGVGVVVEAFIDYEYKFVARHAIPSKDHLTAFFGSITFYIGIGSLLFQLLVTNRVLKRFGVGWAILLLPASLVAAFLALAMRPELWAAAVLQLVDGTLSYSIHRSGTELLYLPVPPKTRNAAKGFIDMFVDRTGRAVGAVLLLLFTAGFAFSISTLSVIAASLALVWLLMGAIVKREYVHSFRRALEKKTVEPEALQLQQMDGATMRTLLGLLASDDERQVLYALDLLNAAQPDRWRSDINRLIHHQSSAVRARTIALLASWNDPSIVRKEFINHPDYETARIATATALRLHWTDSGRDRELLNSLLRDSSPVVVREAITTAGVVRHRAAATKLIARLADKDLRRDARQALLNFGEALIPELARRLSDPSENPKIRVRIPKTLALTGSQRAANVLLLHLNGGERDLDHVVLRALNSMRAAFSSIVIEPAMVLESIQKEREQFDRLMTVSNWLATKPASDKLQLLLQRAVMERIKQARERIFRLLGLIYSPQDLYSAYYNYEMKPELRPAAIEFLDNILSAELKETIIPLLEEQRAPASRLQQRFEFISINAAFAMLTAGGDPWLETLVAAVLSRPIRLRTGTYAFSRTDEMNQQSVALSPIDKVLRLQGVDIFKHTTTEMMAYIGSIAIEVNATRGQVIFAEDEISDAMYVVVAGRVRLDKKGKEVLSVGSGQSFGAWALFDRQPRVMQATALEDVHLLKICSEDFYDLLSDHNDITPAIFRAVIERVNHLLPD